MAKVDESFKIPDNYNNSYFKEIDIPKLKKDFDFEFPLKTKVEDLKEVVTIISFSKNKDEPYKKLFENSPIVNLNIKVEGEKDSKEQKIIRIITGNYCGIIFNKDHNIIIQSRFGDAFLKRMLNVLNDVYIQTEVIEGKINNVNPFLQILIHLFIQKLEKASIFGLPREYKDFKHNDYKVIGRLDINNIIRKNIPFCGKISTISREQTEVREIVEVLNYTIKECEKLLGDNKSIINRINNIRNNLKVLSKNLYPNKYIIEKAKNHKTLQNPVFSEYKKVLEYAELIINNSDIEFDNKQNKKSRGYLFDASELFEIYLEKLLRKDLIGWTVKQQEKIKTYEKTFFAREMRPDLVLHNDTNNQTLVFDVKYKDMNYNYYDVDREDFFQIHTYMAHYFDENKKNKLIAGGLLYPIKNNKNIDEAKAKAEKWLDNTGNFVISGINLNGLDEPNLNGLEKIEKFGVEIQQREKDFVERINQIINPKNTKTHE